MNEFSGSGKASYKKILALSLPIALQNLVMFSLNLLDSVMVGQLGESEIAAVGQANQPFFIFMIFIYGLSCGACVLTSQYWSRGETRAIRHIFAMAMSVALFFAVIVVGFILAFPQTVMGFYSNDPEVIRIGASYLRYAAPSFIFSALSASYLGSIVSVEEVKLPLKINSVALVLNSILNYIFIFGKFGAPAMGVEGAGLATLIARAVEFGLVITYIIFFDKRVGLRIRDFLRPSVALAKDFFKYGGTVMLNEFLWAFGISMFSVIIGRLDTHIVSAYNIVVVVEKMSLALLYGISKAAAVIVGKEVGANRFDSAYRHAKIMIAISLAAGVFASTILAVSTMLIPQFFKITAQGYAAAKVILAVYIIFAPLNAFNSTSIVGVLRAGGDTRFALVLDISFIWFLSIPLSVLFVYLNMPLWLIIAAMRCEEIAKLVIGVFRIRSKKWINDVTRDEY